MRSASGRFRLAMFAMVPAGAGLFQAASAMQAASLPAQSVAVRQAEGEVRGFLVLRTLDGETIADGDSTQVTHGREVTNRVVFHFKDGSLQDETVVFSQSGHFHQIGRAHV